MIEELEALETAAWNKKKVEPHFDNVKILLSIVSKFVNLEEFINQIAINASETHPNSNHNGIKILTIHSSKGLEFDYVYLPNWNQGNVP